MASFEENYDYVQRFENEIGNKFEHEIAIIFNKNEESIKYLHCELRSRSNRNYQYKDMPGNHQIPVSLTIKNSGKGIDAVIKKYINYGKNNINCTSNVLSLEIEAKKQVIESDIEIINNILQENDNRFYTIVLVEDGKEYYPGDIEEFKKIFLNRMESCKTESKGTCYICNKNKSVGYRGSDIFSFSTFEKPSFNYALDIKNHFITLPLCLECYSNLLLGKRILDEKLKLKFYGAFSNVYLLPEFHGERSHFEFSVAKEFISGIENIKKIIDSKSSNYKAFELSLLNGMASSDTPTTLNFLFVKESKSEMKIQLNLRDIPFSRIYDIIKVKEKTESVFEKILDKFDSPPHINFEIIYNIFKSKREKDFYDYLQSIFYSLPISLKTYKKEAVNFISNLKLKGKNYFFRGIQIIMTAYFVDESTHSCERRGNLPNKTTKEKLEQHFEMYPRFFRTPEEKFVYLLGMIHSKVAYLQKSKNIEGTVDLKLKAYRMKPSDFKSHFTDLMWKVKQYSKENKVSYINHLGKIASEYQQEAGHDWEADTIDLNYMFLAGELSSSLYFNGSDSPSEDVEYQEEPIEEYETEENENIMEVEEIE